MAESDYGTTPQHAKRAKKDGIPISEYSIRRLIRLGLIPVRYIGPKAIFRYSDLIRYLNCEDGADNSPATVISGPGIRQIDVR